MLGEGFNKPITGEEKLSARERVFIQESSDTKLSISDIASDIASKLNPTDLGGLITNNLGFVRKEDSDTLEKLVVCTIPSPQEAIKIIQQTWNESTCPVGKVTITECKRYYPIIYDNAKYPEVVFMCHSLPCYMIFEVGDKATWSCLCKGSGLALSIVPKSVLLSSFKISHVK